MIDHLTSLFERQYQRSHDELDRRLIFRIVAIVLGYLIVRPVIVKFMDRTHKASMNRQEPTKYKDKSGFKKKSPNQLRFGHLGAEIEVSDDTDSDNDESTAGTTGRKVMTEEEKHEQSVRRRQRRVLRAKLDESELQKFAEDEWEDPDLVDLFPPPPPEK